jgi:hydroxymethylbilane synthase
MRLQSNTLRIGTRGSPLALAQAHEVRNRLAAAHARAPSDFDIIVIKTTGDMVLDRPLAEIGGKGLFTKEIEEALLAREIDLAVHSMKDMATAMPGGLKLAATLPREDVRDAFVSPRFPTLAAMPAGSVVGTSSLRRQAQVRRLRPDLTVVGFRGNVQTRLKKLEDGVADATFLALAGLRRLGLEDRATAVMDTREMLPAVAQGAIALQIRDGDTDTEHAVAPLNDEATHICVTAERAFLARLEGSCRTPIAGLAQLIDGQLQFRGSLLATDGHIAHDVAMTGAPASALSLGEAAAADILDRAGHDFLRHTA